MAKKPNTTETSEQVAGNGLLHRRFFLQSGAAIAGTAAALSTATTAHAASIGETSPPWMLKQGTGFTPYGVPSHWRNNVTRIVGANAPPGREVTGSSRTPLQMLEGTITPAGLHYERHHNGVPDIDPDKHELTIHGMVRQPLVFNLNALLRYPMDTRIHYVECAGNSGGIAGAAEPQQANAGVLHGLLSCSEWTGVKLSVLLEEAGLDPRATWILAEGADAAGMSRSVPLAKAMDDALVALFQNGERVRPANGYPMRLLLPGYEGNMNVKWLRRIMLTEAPTMTKDETSKYTITLADGKSLQFVLPQEGKSVITHPSPGLVVKEPGLYEISGIAWSGYGKIAKVEISADGGRSWAQAALQEPVLSKAVTRFRLPWRWNGGPAVLQSRATDDTGYVQPTRGQMIASRGNRTVYHSNAITTWSVSDKGEVKHAYV